MEFNEHSKIKGQHAFLGASKYHWINYSDEKITQSYIRWLSVQKGTELHDFACHAIRLGIKLPKSNKTLNRYVNDAIGFRLKPEQPLYYSENCFGTADAIGFDKNFLRIHDLKTGTSKTSMHQLEIYMAIFCLEYKKSPFDIDSELRIYQNDDIIISEPDPMDIRRIMDKIIEFDRVIDKLKKGDESV